MMESRAGFTIAGSLVGSTLILSQLLAAQGQAPTPQGRAAAAPPSVVCVGTPQFAAQQAQAAAQPGGQGRGAPPPDAPPLDVTTTAIPGVIAAGQKWTKVWEATGNNGDGIVADKAGNLLTAQEVNSAVVKIDQDDKASVLFSDTHGVAALAIDHQGRMFAAQRLTPAAIVTLAPEKKIVANTFADGTTLPGRGGNGQTIVGGGFPNDLAADSKGGAYFTEGCLYYASPGGKITLVGDDLRANGIVLSPDDKVLYVTNGEGGGGRGAAGGAPAPMPGTIVAFDVRSEGTLANRRTFATLQSGNGDGSAVDSTGRLYVTAGATVQVFGKDGKYLGTIPTPSRLVSVAFAGPDRKTLYIVATPPFIDGGRTIYRIPMIAQGLRNRGK